MSQFRKSVEAHFEFLNRYGYKSYNDNSLEIVSYIGRGNRIEVVYSAIHYELTCEFIDETGNRFGLQDALDYACVSEHKGLYQIANKNEIEIGVSYLAEIVKQLFEKIDISNSLYFQKIYLYSVEIQKAQLQNYYLQNELKRAEDYWRKKDYTNVRMLLEKNIDFLSSAQQKKLEYIKEHQLQ